MQTRGGNTSGAPVEANPVTHKYSTVALVPITDDVPLTPFTYELYHSLCAIGKNSIVLLLKDFITLNSLFYWQVLCCV